MFFSTPQSSLIKIPSKGRHSIERELQWNRQLVEFAELLEWALIAVVWELGMDQLPPSMAPCPVGSHSLDTEHQFRSACSHTVSV